MWTDILAKTKSLNIFKKKSKSFLGIDIGGSAIKIVQLKKDKGVAVLETYGEMSLGPVGGTEVGRSTNLNDKQISSSILDLIKESRVSVFNCGISIPIRSSLVFEIEVPEMPEKQLQKIVPIEARRYIPVPIAEVILDWRIIPEDPLLEDDGTEDNRPAVNKFKDEDKIKEGANTGKKLKIFVVAIHKNAIEKYRSIAKQSQLALNFLEIEIFSTIRSVVDHNISTVAILDVGSSVSKLYIVEYGVVKDSHIINKGSQDITLAISRTLGISIKEAEEKKREIDLANTNSENKEINEVIETNLKYILMEVNKVLKQYQTKNSKNIKELIFTGGGTVVKGLEVFTSNNLEINARIADPFSKVKTPAFLDDVLGEIGPEFAVAVGLALRGLEG
ncbi:MAG: pilus assembly protein PilM [Candidatus Pacebacteria bacterium]|nr:pilus assembly protein PilM [Candidatus Paceibacterota bacterium]